MSSMFEELLTGGAPSVRRLLGRTETLELEFKNRAPHGRGGTKEDKRNLGKALSAFANSMGGVLVWGVDCRPGEDGADCVQGFTPISDLRRFSSDMQSLVVEALAPRHPAIRVEPIYETEDAGFLVVEVPLSGQRPHMSLFNERGYFRRSGATSRQMEHADIRDAFQRRTTPSLNLYTTLRNGGVAQLGNGMQDRHVLVDFYLRNTSRVSARQPYIAFKMPASIPYGDIEGAGITVTTHDGIAYFEQISGRGVIHPGTSKRLALLRKSFRTFGDYQQPALSAANLWFKADILYGCLDMELQHAGIHISNEEMKTAIDPSSDLIWVDL